LATFAVASFAGLSPPMAAGFMILAACPGGITSNMLTFYAKGDLALSITLTAVVSLLGFITVPWIVTFALQHFMTDGTAVTPPAKIIAGSVFLLTLLPVGAGMLLAKLKPEGAKKIEPAFNNLSAVLFVVVVVGAVASNWTLFIDNVASIGAAALMLIMAMMATGFGTAKAMSLPRNQAVTIAIETGLQNAAMGLVIANTVLQRPELGLPSAIYGVLMYAPALAFVKWARRDVSPSALQQAA